MEQGYRGYITVTIFCSYHQDSDVIYVNEVESASPSLSSNVHDINNGRQPVASGQTQDNMSWQAGPEGVCTFLLFMVCKFNILYKHWLCES